MTQGEISSCQEAIAKCISNVEMAEFIQDLSIRLESAASTMESAIQECNAIFEDMEQIANKDLLSRNKGPISVAFSPKVEEGHQLAIKLWDALSNGLLQGAKRLEDAGIIWFAENEPIKFDKDGQTIDGWYVKQNGDFAVVCIDYLGGPRIEVPFSSISRRLFE